MADKNIEPSNPATASDAPKADGGKTAERKSAAAKFGRKVANFRVRKSNSFRGA